jgi:4-carboxymuconolactone decarboxylase
MKTRRKVLGEAHVAKAETAKTAFDEPFQDLIVDAAWGRVWSRPDLTLRERSMVTIAILAANGQHEELVMHARAAGNTGASLADIREVLLHVAIYAGVPAANHAFKLIKEAVGNGAAGKDRP